MKPNINSVATTLVGFGMLVGVGVATAPAQAFTLADVINNGNSITIGDKTFSNFAYLGLGGIVADEASDVVFTPFVEEDEVGFTLSGQFIKNGFLPLIGLSYDVKTVSGAPLIYGSNFTVGGILPGTTFIGGEQILFPDNTFASLSVSQADISDTVYFSPVSELKAFKAIAITSGTGFLFVRQSYAQVPEPLTMLGVGASVAIGTFFKKKLAKK